jgi:omega-6 fatty acid desaturase (delta-12 desaturase)
MPHQPIEIDEQSLSNPVTEFNRNAALRAINDLIRPSVARAIFGEFLPTISLVLITLTICATWLYPLVLRTNGWAIPIYAAGCGMLAVWILRLFVVQHDAGHQALSESRPVNTIIGHICSVFEFTPFLSWHRHHWHHHMTSGNLETQDGLGDIYTLTVAGFQALAGWQQTVYRIIRNRWWFLILMPTGLFLLLQRFPLIRFPFSSIVQKPTRAELVNIFALNGIYVAVGWLSFQHWSTAAPWIISYLIGAIAAATLGIILFYTQHQFESTYYEHNERWSFDASALRGSMTLRMPFGIMEWAIGFINFHALHHLKPNIPMYNLHQCHVRLKGLGTKMPECSLSDLWNTFELALWDESQQRMISFAELDASGKTGPNPNERLPES